MKKSYFGFSKTVFSLLIKMHMQPNLLQVLSCTGKEMHVWREREEERGGGGGGVLRFIFENVLLSISLLNK